MLPPPRTTATIFAGNNEHLRAIIYYRPQALSFSLPLPPILLHLSRTHTHKTFARNVHYRKFLEALDLREKDDKRVANVFILSDFKVIVISNEQFET